MSKGEPNQKKQKDRVQTQTHMKKNINSQTTAMLQRHVRNVTDLLERLECIVEGKHSTDTTIKNKKSFEIQGTNELLSYEALKISIDLFYDQMKENRSENVISNIYYMFDQFMKWTETRLEHPYSHVDFYCLKFAQSFSPIINNLEENDIYVELQDKVKQNSGTEVPDIDTATGESSSNKIAEKYYGAKHRVDTDMEEEDKSLCLERYDLT